MFKAIIYDAAREPLDENNKDNIVATEWACLEIPKNARAFKKQNRTMFKAMYSAPQRFPTKGRVTLDFMDTRALNTEYNITDIELVKETDFSQGYEESPDEKWVQLNSADSRFTIQLKLVKLPKQDVSSPVDMYYHIYGIEMFVVHVRPPPTTDKSKALSI